MESTPKKAPRSKFPALLVVALALVALVFVIWRVDSAPSTNDAYASADTIDVVPEVSGRIVERGHRQPGSQTGRFAVPHRPAPVRSQSGES